MFRDDTTNLGNWPQLHAGGSQPADSGGETLISVDLGPVKK